MFPSRTAAVVTAALSVVHPARGADAIDKDKIVGVWEITKTEDGAPPGTRAEFGKDGSLKFTFKDGDKLIVGTGTYKLDGAKLVVTVKVDGKESSETATVAKLSDDAMTTKDEHGKATDYKKIKK